MVRFENVGMRYGLGPEVLRDISFSLDLIHTIVLRFLPKLIRSMGFTFELNCWLYFTLALFVILLFSAVSYELLEKNLNLLAKRI